ncbi:MAG: UPF0280 family protein [Candidatus Omnitrophica bacterium]|nr:UPF0280 family protein [Candidatus Omnitrophota bacterium]
MYEKRFYRSDFSKDWFSFEASIKETEVLVKSKKKIDLRIIKDLVKKYRQVIEDYIRDFPEFKNTLSAFKQKEEAPPIISEMIEKTAILDIGPMASVAGAIAQYAGQDLLKFSPELLVENGGDVFIKKKGDLLIGIYAGKDSFINEFSLLIKNLDSSLGICSSSSFLGHSLSLGSADLTTVISSSAVFADALATKLANMINNEEDLDKALGFSKNFALTKGVLIVKADKLGLWGDIELVRK